MRKAQWYPTASGFVVDIEHSPASSHFVRVSGQLRPFLVKLLVTLVANMICTGEFSGLMGVILPYDLLGGEGCAWWLYVPVRQTPCFFLLQHHQGSHQYPSLPGHCYSVCTEQPTAMDCALGWCLSLSEGAGCPLRPPAFPVRASPQPPQGAGIGSVSL